MELTKQQLKIVSMLAEGLRAKEIGQKLGISSKTVESHYVQMKAKMGAKTLPHIVHVAHRQKIIQ